MVDLPKNRLELIEFFNQHLVGEYEYYLEEGQSKKDVGITKTYLLEGNLKDGEGNNTHYVVLDLLKRATENRGFEVQESHDELFFILEKKDDKFSTLNKTFFVDARDSRFWVVNTLAKIEFAKDFFANITSDIDIDHAWFPSQMLKRMMQSGQPKGYGGFFDNLPSIKGLEAEKKEEAINQLSMKLWGNLANDFLEVIEGSEKLRRKFSFSNARVKHFIGLREENESITDDWYYNGKVTSVGKSFNAHLDLINGFFLSDYKNIIEKKIEKELSLSFSAIENSDSVKITGEPIKIRFNDDQSLDVNLFFQSVFDGTKPFRLLGRKIVDKSDFIRVNALDMHIGEQLLFDILPKEISIYLPQHTCGNSVARFLTLFQRHFIPTSVAMGLNNETLF